MSIMLPLDGNDIGPLVERPAGIDHLAFTVTNHCNLRCVYCPQGSHPDEFHAETPAQQIELIENYVAENKVTKISLGYYGETMLIPGWEKIAARLLDLGVRMNFVSSFSRIMKPEEVAVVSRFHDVQISIDTINPDVLKRIRKAVDVRTILYNTHLIRSHVIAHDLPMPRLIWTAVVSNRVVQSLPDLVAMAISSGIRDIACNDLAYMNEEARLAAEVCNVVDLPLDEFTLAYAAIHRARRLAVRHGVRLSESDFRRVEAHADAVLQTSVRMQLSRRLRHARDIDPTRPIFVYGAGDTGRELRSRLSPEVTVRAIIDSNRRGTCDGLPLITLDDYKTNARSDDLILIASMFEDEIEAKLLESGINHYARAFSAARAPDQLATLPQAHDRHSADRQGIQGTYRMPGDENDDVPPGRTRLCLAPWTEIFFDPKGEAYSCCMRGRVMGVLRGGTGIDDILRSEEYRALRRQLLTGQDLDPECRYCEAHAVTTPEEMKAKVMELFKRNETGNG